MAREASEEPWFVLEPIFVPHRKRHLVLSVAIGSNSMEMHMLG